MSDKTVVDEFLEDYDFLEPNDSRLEGCEPVSYEIGLRTFKCRETLVGMCRNMQGVGGSLPRRHYIVKSATKENFVELWAEKPKPLPESVIALSLIHI